MAGPASPDDVEDGDDGAVNELLTYATNEIWEEDGDVVARKISSGAHNDIVSDCQTE